nr:hypothetical protein [Tanacetum cinerariifolium]
MVDDLLSTRIGFATRTALESYTKDFENKVQEERKLYIDVVEKSVKDIIKDEVKSHEYPFDLSKPLPLIEAQGRQVVPGDYFFNNDLEYLKCRSSSRKYITSKTKTKATKYFNIEGIEDMVMELWCPVKKLSNLEQDVIFDLNVALRMFTRHVVILKRVEDLQLGVNSYQKKLNLTKPKLSDLTSPK